MFYDLYEAEEKPYDEIIEDEDYLLFVLADTKSGFTYTFDTLTSENLQQFILECNQDVPGVPNLNNIVDSNKWYLKISTPYNVGVLVSQIYQAYSLYENSNARIRQFVISYTQELQHISNVNAITWTNSRPGINVWGEQINLVGESHCGIGMKVFNKIEYVDDL